LIIFCDFARKILFLQGKRENKMKEIIEKGRLLTGAFGIANLKNWQLRRNKIFFIKYRLFFGPQNLKG